MKSKLFLIIILTTIVYSKTKSQDGYDILIKANEKLYSYISSDIDTLLMNVSGSQFDQAKSLIKNNFSETLLSKSNIDSTIIQIIFSSNSGWEIQYKKFNPTGNIIYDKTVIDQISAFITVLKSFIDNLTIFTKQGLLSNGAQDMEVDELSDGYELNYIKEGYTNEQINLFLDKNYIVKKLSIYSGNCGKSEMIPEFDQNDETLLLKNITWSIPESEWNTQITYRDFMTYKLPFSIQSKFKSGGLTSENYVHFGEYCIVKKKPKKKLKEHHTKN
jgi:hypothetical protein